MSEDEDAIIAVYAPLNDNQLESEQFYQDLGISRGW